MWQLEQSYKGNQEQLIGFLSEYYEELEDGSIVGIANGIPLHDDGGGLDLDVVLIPPMRPMTDEERKKHGIPGHGEDLTTTGEIQTLGRIKTRPVGQQAMWLCATDNEACIRHVKTLAGKLHSLGFGPEPLFEGEDDKTEDKQEDGTRGARVGRRIAPKEGSKRYREWQERYSVIKPWLGRYSYQTMLENLERRRDGLACSESTLRKTIKAGEAGELS